MTERFDLGAIEDALADGDRGAALAAALVAWRQTRASALADLIDVISSKIQTPAIDGDTAWSSAARTNEATSVGALLAAVPSLPASFLPTAGDTLNGFPEDPRIAMAVATWTLDPPTTSSSTHPFWTRTIDAMTRAGDARVVPVLKKRLKMKAGGSQFWPKLYKALEKAIPKIEKTPRTDVDTKAVAKLTKAAGKLAPAKPATRKIAAKTTTTSGPPLVRAAEHLGAGRVQPGIDALLDAWRTHDRQPQIGDAIDRATRLLPTWDRPLTGTDKQIAKAWDALLAAEPQAAMPQLLDNLVVGGPSIAERHLVALAALPDDPRVAMRLAELCARSGISPERTQFWKATLELIARIRDPRTAAALCTTFGNFEGDYYNHHRQARRILGEWAKAPPVPAQLGPGETKALAAIDEALARLEAKRDRTEHDLVKAICDAWDDTGPRLVYADWLTERQHPRGELIVLACKASLSAAETERLRDVKRAANLLGPFDAFAKFYAHDLGVALDRGLPTRLVISWDTSPLVWRKLAGYPLLGTIESITFDTDDGRVPPATELARVARDPIARRLSRIAKFPKNATPALAEALGRGWHLKDGGFVRS